MKQTIQLLQLIVGTATAVLTLVLVIFAMNDGIDSLNQISEALKKQTSIDQRGILTEAKREETSARMAIGVDPEQQDQPDVESGRADQRNAADLNAAWLNGLLLSLSPSGECAYENDGECDAIGFADSTNLCPLDTDTDDCSDSTEMETNEVCVFESDGECDAEGLWKSTNLCPAETDEADCAGFQRTSELCRSENDGTCDAMGNPESTNQCPVATDLMDCRGSLR